MMLYLIPVRMAITQKSKDNNANEDGSGGVAGEGKIPSSIVGRDDLTGTTIMRNSLSKQNAISL